MLAWLYSSIAPIIKLFVVVVVLSILFSSLHFFYVAFSDPDYMKFKQWLGPLLLHWTKTMHANIFWQFSRNADICVIPWKLSDIHLHAWLFSKSQWKVLIIDGTSCSPDLRVQHILFLLVVFFTSTCNVPMSKINWCNYLNPKYIIFFFLNFFFLSTFSAFFLFSTE